MLTRVCRPADIQTMRAATLNRIVALLGIAATLVAWLALAPRQLGGSASYVVVHGTSMEPRFHGGDLVVLRTADDYGVGDVAAYHSPDLNQLVMHRIVARHGDRYLFKGDNNDFLDYPTARRVPLAGKLWVRVPRVGGLVQWLREPANAALAVVVLALLAAGGSAHAGGRTRRSRKQRSLGDRVGSLPRRPLFALNPESAQTVLMSAGGVALVASLLAVRAFAAPATQTVAAPDLYQQTGRFSYTANAPAGDVYPNGRVKSGEAVFVRLVDRVSLAFDYRLRSRAERAVSGTAALTATVRGDNGWQRAFVLRRATPFQGDATRVSATLDLRRLRAVLDRVEATTGVANGSYRVAIRPTIRVAGSVAGQPVRETFAPALPLWLDTVQLRLEDGRKSLTRTQSGSGTRVVPNQLSLLGRRLDVGAARWLALVAFAGALVAAAFALRVRSERRTRTAASEIADRYGRWIVNVAPLERDGTRVVNVETIDGLVRLAEHYDCAILREHGADGDAYVVEEGGTTYRHRPAGRVPQPELRVVELRREASGR